MNVGSNFKEIKGAEIIVICVPTPVHQNHAPDLGPLKNACKSVSRFLEKGQTIIIESTINPGVCREVALPILLRSGLKPGEDFYLAHCPERINPGDNKWTVRNIPRVVGGLNKKSLEVAMHFYRSIISAKIKPMGSLEEAEAVKIIENSFRDVNIAFVNELAMSFAKMNIDITNVIKGASTKPFSFMPHYPGCGVGGHCIPVDPYYLIKRAREIGFRHNLLISARKINNQMPYFTVKQTQKGLRELGLKIRNSKIAVLGLSYKAGIDDHRESPAWKIIKMLKAFGAEVSTYDPYLPDKSSAKSIEEALVGSQAVIIATAHKDFAKLTPQYLLESGVKVVVDGRNFLSKNTFAKSGLVYKGIGR